MGRIIDAIKECTKSDTDCLKCAGYNDNDLCEHVRNMSKEFSLELLLEIDKRRKPKIVNPLEDWTKCEK
jgi:hypothetical protein